MGPSLESEATGDMVSTVEGGVGRPLALSDDGTVVATGAVGNDGNGDLSVR